MDRERLRETRFFEFLSDAEREEFLEVSKPASFAPSERIIVEGHDPGSLYVLLSGTVEVSKRLPGGGERVLAEIDAADGPTVVGERGLLGGSGASATVRARSAVEAVGIPRESFRRMVSEGRPAALKLSYRVARLLARRLTRLDDEVVNVIRELERRGDADLDVFRDRLITEWTV